MFHKLSFLPMCLLLSVVSGCGSSSSVSTGSPSPASPSPQPSANATPVSYDPCVLMTAQDASTLTGVTYPSGMEQTANGIKECIYGYQTQDVFLFGIGQAPDAATAKAYATEAEAQFQQAANGGIPVTQVQGVGDAAAVLQGSYSANGTAVNASAIYVLKGAIFFGMSDVAVNRAVPTSSALQAQALTVLGRL
jgi:hypothetical protein